MRRLAVIGAGIIAVSGVAATLALRSDGSAGANSPADESSQVSPPQELKNQNSVSVDMDSSSTTASGSSSSSTSLSINGQDIDIPTNGKVHKRIVSDGQITDISVHNSTSQSGNTNSHSTNLEVFSHSSDAGSSTIND